MSNMSFMLLRFHGWSEKRVLNSSLVVDENKIQPAEIQSILVPGHHRNGQEPDHVEREEFVPATGWGDVCGLKGL